MNMIWSSFIFVVIMGVAGILGLITNSPLSCLAIGLFIAILATVPAAWRTVRGNTGAQRAAGILIGIIAAIVLFNAAVGFWSPEVKGTWNDVSSEYKHDFSMWLRNFVKGGYKSPQRTSQAPVTTPAHQPAPVVQQSAPASQPIINLQPAPQITQIVPIPTPVPVYREPYPRMARVYPRVYDDHHYDRHRHRDHHPRHERHRNRHYPHDRRY